VVAEPDAALSASSRQHRGHLSEPETLRQRGARLHGEEAVMDGKEVRKRIDEANLNGANPFGVAVIILAELADEVAALSQERDGDDDGFTAELTRQHVRVEALEKRLGILVEAVDVLKNACTRMIEP
jgi:hypothetical protein